MSEEIKDLIEKIQQEGVKAAEEKAQEIEQEARRRAQELIANAQAQAAKMLGEAKDSQAKLKNTTEAALKQAARDMLIVLKKEINNLLGKLALSAARQALSPQELAGIISRLAGSSIKPDSHEVVVSLSPQDLEKIKDGFMNRLQDELKKGLVLAGSEEIKGGLRISYNGNKSYFDLSDQALADYITTQLKPKLAELFK